MSKIKENIMQFEDTYLELLRKTLKEGVKIESRNGVTHAISNTTIQASCRKDHIPLITTKEVNYRAAIVELLWFMRGETNLDFLHKYGVHIWDLWADKDGELGPIYGHQWKKQLRQLLTEAKRHPYSRRLLLNSWQLNDLPRMALVPCHYSFQILNYPTNKIKLTTKRGTQEVTSNRTILDTDLIVTMRSSDAFLGMPFNLVNYGVLLHLICSELGSNARNLYINSGQFHIYENHIEAVEEQLTRSQYKNTARLQGTYPGLDIEDLTPDDFIVLDYKHHPKIRAKVSK